MCRREDLNLHGLLHTLLRRAAHQFQHDGKISVQLCLPTNLPAAGRFQQTANTIFYLKSVKITLRGYSLVVELKISNLSARVRFPLPAPRTTPAAVVKSVYTQDLKSCALNKRVGSSPASGTQSGIGAIG